MRWNVKIHTQLLWGSSELLPSTRKRRTTQKWLGASASVGLSSGYPHFCPPLPHFCSLNFLQWLPQLQEVTVWLMWVWWFRQLFPVVVQWQQIHCRVCPPLLRPIPPFPLDDTHLKVGWSSCHRNHSTGRMANRGGTVSHTHYTMQRVKNRSCVHNFRWWRWCGRWRNPNLQCACFAQATIGRSMGRGRLIEFGGKPTTLAIGEDARGHNVRWTALDDQYHAPSCDRHPPIEIS